MKTVADAEMNSEFSDPLIDEVRAIRKAVFEEFDYDLRKLFEDLRKLQEQNPERVVRPRRISPGATLQQRNNSVDNQ